MKRVLGIALALISMGSVSELDKDGIEQGRSNPQRSPVETAAMETSRRFFISASLRLRGSVPAARAPSSFPSD